ncbi:MAG: UvrD-helicase domain-containing protein [Chlamydia sp.]
MSGLNEWQQKAVQTTEGRVLILAGAGSGKTTVLTKRIEYLLSQKVDPQSILGLTFTNKAAKEMASRLAGLVGHAVAKKVCLSTFHSFALYLLKKEIAHTGFPPHCTIADRQDLLRHLQTIVRDILDHEKGESPSLQCLLEDISLSKNRVIPIEEIAKRRTPSISYMNLAKEVFDRLQSCFRIHGIFDFDHMLWLVHDLFQTNEAVLDKYATRFQYIMIDEYQDTNPVQAQIATALSSKWGNLCVVGDDDQSIYSWRGADVANILNFKADVVVTLEQNFRSTSVILHAANKVIEVNTERYEKSLWSQKAHGKPIDVIVAPTEEAEAEAVVMRIIKLREKHGLAWKDFAILYRSNILSKSIEAALLRARYMEKGKLIQSIPYRAYGGDELYDHKEIKDILAYLKVALNPKDILAGMRSLHYPRKGIGEASIERIQKIAEERGDSFFNAIQHITSLQALQEHFPKKALDGMRRYVAVIQNFLLRLKETKSLVQSVQQLIQEIELKEAIFSEVQSQSMRLWKEERISQFLETIALFESDDSSLGLDLLDQCVMAFELQEERKKRSQRLSSIEDDENHVSLMTFHSAKGLEFPVCFLIGVEDHLIPHEKSSVEGGLEEERRLLYVALTRAKDRLFLSMAIKRKKMGTELFSRPSRFIIDIPKECLNPVQWDLYASV